MKIFSKETKHETKREGRVDNHKGRGGKKIAQKYLITIGKICDN